MGRRTSGSRIALLTAVVVLGALTVAAAPAQAQPLPCEPHVSEDQDAVWVQCTGPVQGCFWVTVGDARLYCY